MSDPQQALMNLVLLAHAEIRALREIVGLFAASADPGALVNATNWVGLEAECRRRHLEALKLPLDRFDALLSDAVVQEVMLNERKDAPVVPSDRRD